MNDFTQVRVKKKLIRRLKVKAGQAGRSVTNYIEQLILKDLEEK